MKRIVLSCLLVFCLVCAAVPTLAAVVSEKGGYLPGSNSYEFEYRAQDPGPTVVKDVLPNDQIVIQYGVGATKLPLELEVIMKNRFGEEWQFELKREGGNRERASIRQGERFALDLQGDGSAELVMEFSALDGKKGTFTFYRPDRVPGAASNETGNGTGGMPEQTEASTATETPEAAVNESLPPADAGNVPADVPEEPASAAAEDSGKAAAASPGRGSIVPVIVIALLVIALVVAGAWLVGQRSMPKQKEKGEAKKEELVEEKLKENPKRESVEEPPRREPAFKHQMITRSPRRKR